MSLFLRKQKGSSGLIWACGVKSNSSILEEEEKHEEGENYGFVDGNEGEGRKEEGVLNPAQAEAAQARLFWLL